MAKKINLDNVDSPILATLDGQAIGWVEDDTREPGDASGALVLYEEDHTECGFGGLSDNCEPWEAWPVLLAVIDGDPRIEVVDNVAAGAWYDAAAEAQV